VSRYDIRRAERCFAWGLALWGALLAIQVALLAHADYVASRLHG